MSCGKYEGSQIQYDVVLQKNIMVSMRDGARLATDIYLPAINGKPVDGRFPALLERTPYDNGSIRMTNIGRYFARRGYVCVFQDVRGRGESDGDWFFVYSEEAPDGYDTVRLGLSSNLGAMGRWGQSAFPTRAPPNRRLP